MKKTLPSRISAIVFILFVNTVNAQVSGLHNSTKIFTNQQDMLTKDFTDPMEVNRTWQSAIVRIPTSDGQSKISSITRLTSGTDNIPSKLPTIIYLHGCAGVWPGTYRRVKYFADKGYLVIAPVSFARKKYPKSCSLNTHHGAMYPHTLTMRLADVGHAIETAKQFTFVDAKNIALVGLSEGGVLTANFIAQNEKQKLTARVVEGWTCRAGMTSFGGMKAPESEPVLTLTSDGDPWFQSRWTKGHCGPFLNKDNGSKSLVYDQEPIASLHEILEFDEPRNEALRFLETHLKN